MLEFFALFGLSKWMPCYHVFLVQEYNLSVFVIKFMENIWEIILLGK